MPPPVSIPTVDWLPIAPAAHYLSGGVITDLDGASALPGLWAAGEVACTGVHGANRLASNSLLEGMVFGARLAEAIEEGRDGAGAHRRSCARCSPIRRRATSAASTSPGWRRPRGRRGTVCGERGADVTKSRHRLQRAMTEGAGVLRTTESLATAAEEVADVAATVGGLARRARRR